MTKPKQKPKLPKSTAKQAVELNIAENKYFVWGLIGAFLLCVLSVTTYKIEDDDFFWHLNTGRFIAENGFVPDKDILGFASQEAEWIPFEWGWDVISYSLYKAGGYNLIFIFRSAIFLMIFFLYFRLLNKFKVNSIISVILLFALLIGLLNRLSPRPHIFTYLFLSILLYLLLSFKYLNREKYFKYLYSLPLIFLIWANLHLGVLTGVLLFLLFIVSETVSYYKNSKSSAGEYKPLTPKQFKHIIIVFVCSLGVLLINPHGLSTYSYAYGHTKMRMLESIAEWLAPFSSQAEGGLVLTLYKILLFTGLIILIYSYRKRDFFFAIIFAMFAVYSLRAIRFTVDYEIVIIPFLAVSLNYYLNRFEKINSFAAKIFYGNEVKALFTVTLIFLAFQFQSDSFYISLQYNREAGPGISSRYFPVRMVKFIKENNIKGTPFNNFDTGGYLAWEIPGQKIFIDSRNINDKLFDEYLSITNMKPGFREKINSYGMDYAYFFDPKFTRFPKTLKQSVTEYFFNDSSWALVYWDDLTMLFVKNITDNGELISKYGYKVFNPYTALFNRPVFEENIRKYPVIAEEEIRRKAVSEPEGYFYGGMNEIAQKILRIKNPEY